MNINAERLKHNLLELGQLANADTKGYTRIAFSAEERAAFEWVETKLEQLGIPVERDAVGNLFARYGETAQPAIAFGSHLDTVPQGGLYDGALGVIAGLECLQTLVEQQIVPSTPLELVCFVGEEANPLGGTFGSRAVTGQVPYSVQLVEKLQSFPFTWEDILSVKRNKERYKYFLEFHIEQGNVLETTGNKIGIVTAITGILRFTVQIRGKASHSGTTPMDYRKDALVVAANLVVEINRLARKAGNGIVATVGELEIFPNLANVVPGEVVLTVEIRGGAWEQIEQLEEVIKQWINNNIEATVSRTVEKQPGTLSTEVQASIEQSCERLQIPYQYMLSGANHDANSFTSNTKVGMIFVPSRDGISHHPDEYTSWDDIELGANVMLNTLLNLCEK